MAERERSVCLWDNGEPNMYLWLSGYKRERERKREREERQNDGPEAVDE